MDRNVLKIMFFLFIVLFFNAVNSQTIVDLEGIETGKLKSKIEKNTATFFDRINSAYKSNSNEINYEGISITDDGIINSNLLWSTSPFMIQEMEIYEKLLKRVGDGVSFKNYELRNIRIFFKNAEKGERNRQGVIAYDKKGNINDIYIAIDYKLYSNVMIQGKSVEDLRHREIILDFVENFRTAYNRKDLDFIEKVFSDDALIIVGKTIKIKITDKDIKNTTKTKYTVKGKKEYIDALKNVFRNNKYVNVEFDELDLVRHYKYHNMYGVTVKQEWFATGYRGVKGYSDKGYVFLLIDLKDIDNPIIHVRTWDEKKSFNIKSFPIGDFN